MATFAPSGQFRPGFRQPDKKMKKTAVALSCAFHPFVLPLYLLLLVFTRTTLAAASVPLKHYVVWTVILYSMAIPALTLGLLRALGRVADWEIDDRRQRTLPLLVGTLCYLLCAYTLLRIPAAELLCKFVFAAACCEAMCLVVSQWWKISLHLTGMGAAVALLTVLALAGAAGIMTPLVCTLLASGALAASRLYLGYHDGFQVLAGFCGGFMVTAIAFVL